MKGVDGLSDIFFTDNRILNTVYDTDCNDSLSFSVCNNMLPYIDAEWILLERFANSMEISTRRYEELNKESKVKTYTAKSVQELREKQMEGLDETWTRI